MKFDVRTLVLFILAITLAATASYIATLGERDLNTGYSFNVGQGEKVRTIRVTGQGKAAFKPNQAIIYVGVKTHGLTAGEAVSRNSEVINRVVDALKDLEIPEEDIETTSYNLYPRYSTDGEIIGFEARHMLKVKLLDMKEIGRIIDGAVGAGANQVGGVYFSFTDEKLEELNKLARQRAVENAKSRAKAIAESLGVEIIGVMEASESIYRYEPSITYGLEKGPLPVPAPTTIITPSELEVTVTVQVTFIIE